MSANRTIPNVLRNNNRSRSIPETNQHASTLLSIHFPGLAGSGVAAFLRNGFGFSSIFLIDWR